MLILNYSKYSYVIYLVSELSNHEESEIEESPDDTLFSAPSETINESNPKRNKNKFAIYFEITKSNEKKSSKNDKIATCKLCKEKMNRNVQIKMKNANTSGIQRHLSTYHKKQYFEINRNQTQNSSSTSNITKYISFSSEVSKVSNILSIIFVCSNKTLKIQIRIQ